MISWILTALLPPFKHSSDFGHFEFRILCVFPFLFQSFQPFYIDSGLETIMQITKDHLSNTSPRHVQVWGAFFSKFKRQKDQLRRKMPEPYLTGGRGVRGSSLKNQKDMCMKQDWWARIVILKDNWSLSLYAYASGHNYISTFSGLIYGRSRSHRLAKWSFSPHYFN